ncbi:integral membrane protein [Xylariaceae sp. FL1019]|nr:integral membrane protein [Xylariaceae sp. FL1019]
MTDLAANLPLSMSIAGFIGIAWFIGMEINISLFFVFKRRTSLYFWCIFLCAWGVILQPLAIILANYKVWKDATGSVTFIYLTWFIMVVPQSWILQTTTTDPNLFVKNIIWDRIQFIVFFVQETSLSILYIWKTRQRLQDMTILAVSREELVGATKVEKITVMRSLIYANIVIIVLDAVVLGIQSAGYFYLQGAVKTAVYAIKLKIEFITLNLLANSVRSSQRNYDSRALSENARLASDNTNISGPFCTPSHQQRQTLSSAWPSPYTNNGQNLRPELFWLYE